MCEFNLMINGNSSHNFKLNETILDKYQKNPISSNTSTRNISIVTEIDDTLKLPLFELKKPKQQLQQISQLQKNDVSEIKSPYGIDCSSFLNKQSKSIRTLKEIIKNQHMTSNNNLLKPSYQNNININQSLPYIKQQPLHQKTESLPHFQHNNNNQTLNGSSNQNNTIDNISFLENEYENEVAIGNSQSRIEQLTYIHQPTPHAYKNFSILNNNSSFLPVINDHPKHHKAFDAQQFQEQTILKNIQSRHPEPQVIKVRLLKKNIEEMRLNFSVHKHWDLGEFSTEFIDENKFKTHIEQIGRDRSQQELRRIVAKTTQQKSGVNFVSGIKQSLKQSSQDKTKKRKQFLFQKQIELIKNNNQQNHELLQNGKKLLHQVEEFKENMKKTQKLIQDLTQTDSEQQQGGNDITCILEGKEKSEQSDNEFEALNQKQLMRKHKKNIKSANKEQDQSQSNNLTQSINLEHASNTNRLSLLRQQSQSISISSSKNKHKHKNLKIQTNVLNSSRKISQFNAIAQNQAVSSPFSIKSIQQSKSSMNRSRKSIIESSQFLNNSISSGVSFLNDLTNIEENSSEQIKLMALTLQQLISNVNQLYRTVNNISKTFKIIKSIIQNKLIGVSQQAKEELNHMFFCEDLKCIFLDEKKNFNENVMIKDMAQNMLQQTKVFTSKGTITLEKVKWDMLPDLVQLNDILSELNLQNQLASFTDVKYVIKKEQAIVRRLEKIRTAQKLKSAHYANNLNVNVQSQSQLSQLPQPNLQQDQASGQLPQPQISYPQISQSYTPLGELSYCGMQVRKKNIMDMLEEIELHKGLCPNILRETRLVDNRLDKIIHSLQNDQQKGNDETSLYFKPIIDQTKKRFIRAAFRHITMLDVVGLDDD